MGWAAILPALLGAVGAGVQYASARSAAETQDTLALLNAEAQTQAVEQRGEMGRLQASINAALAAKDKKAAEASAAGLMQQADINSEAARAATRKNREEMAQLVGLQRAAAAKRGVVDTTGSPLALIKQTAMRDQELADTIRSEDENSRRALFREAVNARNQGIIAGIQGVGFQASGVAATQLAITQAAQAKLDMYSQRASASALRAQGFGNLVSSAGSIGMDAYKTFRARPRSVGTQY
jgi:hypothetical protein